MHGHKHFVAALVGVVVVLLLGLAAAVPVKAQDSPAPERAESSAASLERVIGDVTATNPTAKQIGLRLDAGGSVTVVLQDRTVYLRVPPGETDLKKAVKIIPADIGVGDRVYARGRLAADQKSIAALAVIVMTKADLTRTREQERAERQKRTIAGTISALDSKTQEITLSVRARDGTTTIIIQSSEKAVFRRYAADTVRLVQAKPSAFADLRVGDSIRVLGDKNSNGTRVKPEEIISGSFRNIAGIVTAIDVDAGEIRITDLQSRRPLTVRITSDTMVRRMPPTKAATAKPAQGAPPAAAPNRPPDGGRGTTPQGPPGAGPTQGAPPSAAPSRSPEGGGGATPEGRPSAGPAQGAPPAAAPSRPPDGGRGATPEARPSAAATPAAAGGSGLADLERMPVVKFSDLKRDEAVVVLCTVGAEPSSVTAMVVVAGVESLLGAAVQDQTQVVGAWNFFDMSVP